MLSRSEAVTYATGTSAVTRTASHESLKAQAGTGTQVDKSSVTALLARGSQAESVSDLGGTAVLLPG